MKRLKIYLDNCCFNRPYDDQSQIKVALETEAKLFVQGLIADGKIDLVWSYIMKFENANCPYDEQRETIGIWRKMAKEYVDFKPEILAIAAEVMSTGVKQSDSLHVACAIYANCDYFLTTDKRITRYKTDKIKIVTPIEFLEEWSDYNGK